MPLPSLFDLSGRVALVTGASSGLGVTFAEALAEAGADVVLAARRVDRLEEVAGRIRAAGRRALPVACDVTDAAQMEAAVAAAAEELGRLDVVVANAGAVPDGFSMPERIPGELFEQSVRVNLIGTWNTCQSAGRHMLAHGGGSIVVVSSYTGVAGVPNFPPAYQASKAALINITQQLAASWGDRGVRVNALTPGWFPSEMTEAVLAAPVFRARIDDQAALGRAGRPEELVGPLLLLASDASSYMTGAVVAVDGGTSATVGAPRYSEELYGLHDAVMPHGLGARVTPA
ncbi:SDR family NAD(P)-dependent oxidoreductase [Miltoncostaea marina]|uniref:SDR family NAD(P)-dependent oxidoreductase n=1 Tax=Miltoncostaea marina TaxID=2843215 RepID=UPI001C3C1F13|nr:SDR family oxidoreductase [Miltoncostaea marina]